MKFRHVTRVLAALSSRPRPSAGLATRFATAAWWSLIGAVVSRGVALAANVAVARQLGASGFGEFGVVFSTISVLMTLAGLGFGLTVTKFVAEYRSHDRERAARTIRLTLAVSSGAGVGFALATLCASRYIADRVLLSPTSLNTVRVGSLFVAAGALTATQAGILAGLEAFRDIAIVNIVKSVVGGALAVATASWLGPGGCVAAMGVGELCGAVYAQAVVKRRCSATGIPPARKRCLRELPTVLRFSVPSLIASAAATPALWLCRVWMVRSAGFAEAGLFEAANKWALAILFLPTTIGAVQLPMLTHLASEGRRSDYRRLFLANVLVAAASSFLPGVVAAVAAKRLMALNGPEYVAGASVLVVLALSTVVMALNAIVGQGFVSRGHILVRLYADLTLAVLLVVTGWALIPRYGALGFAVAHSVAYGVVSIALSALEWRAAGLGYAASQRTDADTAPST